MTGQDFTRAINQAFQEIFAKHPELGDLFPRQASYRFWTNDRGDRFFYTTEKINHRGKARYVVGIYRFLKSKSTKYRQDFKLVKQAGFATKKQAIDRAYRLLQDDEFKRGGDPGRCWTCGGFSGWYSLGIDQGAGSPILKICLPCQRRGSHPTGIDAYTLGAGFRKTRTVRL